jgi:TonB family protein
MEIEQKMESLLLRVKRNNMKKLVIVLLVIFCKINVGVAQNNNSDSLKIIEKPDQLAECPGGMGAFGKFLQKNLKYPEKALRANVTGKVYVEFIVESNGILTNFNILKSVGFGIDEETIRVLKLSPKWIPAKYKDKSVRSRFTIPISMHPSE